MSAYRLSLTASAVPTLLLPHTRWEFNQYLYADASGWHQMPDLSPEERCRLLANAQGDVASVSLQEKAVALSRQAGDEHDLIVALAALGLAKLYQSGSANDFAGARACHGDCVSSRRSPYSTPPVAQFTSSSR